MFSFLCFMLLAYARWVSTANPNDGSSSQMKNIILLAGQSNMSGRGGVVNNTWDHVIPPESQSKPPILRLSAGLTWEVAQEPLHQDIDVYAVCGVGPGMSFANSLLNRNPNLGVIGLVPCAVGGTDITRWGRGTYLYNQLVHRAQAALNGGGTIRALLWYQGEADTISLQGAKFYKRRLKRFFTHLRADLNLKSLPIIQVSLASGQGPYIDIVRHAQLRIKLHNVKCVDAKGLPIEPDYLHLSTPAQVRLGEMLADTFLTLPVHQSNGTT